MVNRIGKAFTENSQTAYARFVSDAQGNAYYLKNGLNAPQPNLNALFGVTPELAELNIDFNAYSTICGFSIDFEDESTALISWTNPSPNTSYFCLGTYTKQPETGKAGYRYGFNGKEKDNEVKGKGVQYDYGFRIYDARLGKFLSVDPLFKSYPWYTPYQFAGNKPISAIDVDGLEEYIYQYAIDDQLNVTLLKKERNVELRERINSTGTQSGIYEAYNKRTGEKLTDNERGKVQYEYFYKGEVQDIRRKLNGEFEEGKGEIMTLHKENFDKSIYISSPFGKDAMVGVRYDYRREPTDLADAAALKHDKRYDKVGASGTLDALTNKKTIIADVLLIGDVQQIINNYGNKYFKDPYTGKPISEETYKRAQVIMAVFVPIVLSKFNTASQTTDTKANE